MGNCKRPTIKIDVKAKKTEPYWEPRLNEPRFFCCGCDSNEFNLVWYPEDEEFRVRCSLCHREFKINADRFPPEFIEVEEE